MSHFKVLVISNNPKVALDPYCETDEKYFEKVSVREMYLNEYKTYAIRYKEEKGEMPTIPEFLDWWSGFEPVYNNEEGKIKRCEKYKQKFTLIDCVTEEVIDIFTFYNPKKKYDYYTPLNFHDGSMAFLIDKNGNKNTKLDDIRDLDLVATFEAIEEESGKDYDDYINEFGRVPFVEKTYDQCQIQAKEKSRKYKERRMRLFEDMNKPVPATEITKRNNMTAEYQRKAIDFYWNQPDVMVAEEKGLPVPDDYCCTRSEFVAKANFPITSILNDDVWVQEGQGGWYGSYVGEVLNIEDWARIQREMITEAYNRAMENDQPMKIQVYDYHI